MREKPSATTRSSAPESLGDNACSTQVDHEPGYKLSKLQAFREWLKPHTTAKRGCWVFLAKALRRARAFLGPACERPTRWSVSRAKVIKVTLPACNTAGRAVSANDPAVRTNDLTKRLAHFQHGEQPHTQVVPRLELNLPSPLTAAINSTRTQPLVHRAGHPPPANLHILVVDDNPVNRTLLGRWLSAAGMQVVSVEDGAAAVSLVCQTRFDLILMDVSMPNMNGLEATKMIRVLGRGTSQQAYFENLPILGVSAHAMKGDREAFLATGMDDYITKPIHRGTLFEKIDGLVRQPLKLPAD